MLFGAPEFRAAESRTGRRFTQLVSSCNGFGSVLYGHTNHASRLTVAYRSG